MGEAKRRRLAGERQRQARWQALDAADRKVINRLVEAVETGEHCGEGSDAAISTAGIDGLRGRKILVEAMWRVGQIDNPHPEAQRRFLEAWVKSHGILLRELTCDDDAFFSALRVL